MYDVRSVLIMLHYLMLLPEEPLLDGEEAGLPDGSRAVEARSTTTRLVGLSKKSLYY